MLVAMPLATVLVYARSPGDFLNLDDGS
jgi:hypothetical protein